jgi:N-acetylneuraminic acid mutarotase
VSGDGDAIRFKRRAVLLAVAGAIVVVILGVVGARLLNVRALLRIDETASTSACADAGGVRLPEGHASRVGRWRPLPSFPIAQDELRAAAVGGLVYVGTGLEEKRPGARLTSTDVFFSFDPKRSTYRRLPPLPRRVDHPALVSARGSLYLIGGYHDERPTAETFKYAPASGEWTELAPMPTPRGSPAAAAIGGRIYVAGGSPVPHVGGNPRATGVLEVFDVSSGRWSRGPDMPTPRHHAGAAAVGGEIYVVGGRGSRDVSLANAERFDPRQGSWQRIAPLPLGAGGVALVGTGGRVVAIGGGDDVERWVTPATWSFDPAQGNWQRLADLEVARHGHAAAALRGSVYVFGGAPCSGYGITDTAEALRVPAGP